MHLGHSPADAGCAMNPQLRNDIAEMIRAGREQDLYNCGCSGCPKSSWTDTVDKCECGKGCRCQCTLPAEVERRAAFRAEVEAIRREVMAG